MKSYVFEKKEKLPWRTYEENSITSVWAKQKVMSSENEDEALYRSVDQPEIEDAQNILEVKFSKFLL